MGSETLIPGAGVPLVDRANFDASRQNGYAGQSLTSPAVSTTAQQGGATVEHYQISILTPNFAINPAAANATFPSLVGPAFHYAPQIADLTNGSILMAPLTPQDIMRIRLASFQVSVAAFVPFVWGPGHININPANPVIGEILIAFDNPGSDVISAGTMLYALAPGQVIDITGTDFNPMGATPAVLSISADILISNPSGAAHNVSGEFDMMFDVFRGANA